jgi:DNA-binding NarL/FixJ family response regulator
MGSSNSYKVVLVEPSAIVASGLKKMLNESLDFGMVEHLDSFSHLKDRISALQPHIVIVNPSTIDFDKQFSLRSLFQDFPQVSVVALVYTFFRADILRQYHGVIEITDNFNTIENTLRAALDTSVERKEISENQDLTDREIDVLIAVAKGCMNKEIADKLNISIHTVISHRKNITRKTGIKSVSGLTVYALINNLIGKDEMFL